MKQLSQYLGITTMGVRQHLGQLESDNLVNSTAPVAQPRGRPVSTWQLTAEGHNRFPDAHAQVTLELITNIRDLLGESALEQVIKERAAKAEAGYEAALTKAGSLAEKVNELARLRSEEGYMAEVEDLGDGQYLLIEQHCPICVAATECQGFCQTELETFRHLFRQEADVERQDYLLTGARRCSYSVTARK